jgi:gliding motility-associated-like protein
VRSLCVLIGLVGLLCFVKTLDAQIPTNGLVASFPFNGNAIDETGSGHNGFVHGATLTTDRCGRPNSAYYFNGTDAYIKVTNDNINSPNFTYAVWVNFQPIAPYQSYNILEIGNGTGGSSGVKWGQEIEIMSSLGKEVFTVISGDSSSTYNGMNTQVEAIPNNWYLIVFTRSNTEEKIFINNILGYTSPTFGQTPFFNNPLEILIGGRSNTFYEYFRGSIDDIRIYDRVLNEAEISSLYYYNCSQQTLDSINGSSEVCTGQQNVSYKVPHLPGATISWAYSGTGATILNSTADSITINFSSTATKGILTVTATGTNIPTQSQELTITVSNCSGPPTAGLVAYYPFNGNANDESGNGNNAQQNTALLTTDRCGKPNSAYYFNGTSAYIQIQNNSIRNNNYTYSVWVKMQETPPSLAGYCIYEIGSVPNSSYGQVLGISNDYTSNYGSVVSTGNTNLNEHVYPNNIMPDTNWYNAVITRSDDSIKFYINAKLQFSRSIIGLTPFYNSPLYIILGTRCEFFHYFKGKLDDFSVYNRALSDAEVASLYYTDCSNQIVSEINGSPSVCTGQTSVNYCVNSIAGATYSWSYTGTGESISGISNTVSVDFASNATSGNIQVEVSGPNITTQLKQFPVTVNICNQISTNGLIAYYPFNGNANDESGNGYNGTVNGASLTTDRCGNPNSAYFFDGTTNITLPSNFDLLPRTIDLWFNTENVNYSIYGGIYESDNPFLNYGATGFAIKIINGVRKLLLSLAGITDTINVNANQWYNAAIVVRSDKSIKYYLNGNLIGNKSYSIPVTSVNGLNNAFLGSTRTGDNCFFQGKIDDIWIFNRALSSSEILSLYTTPCSLSAITGIENLCQGITNVNYTVNLIAGASYSWTYNGSGATINGNSNSILVDFSSAATSGTLKVTITGPNILTQSQEFPVVLSSCSTTNGLIAYYPFNNGSLIDESGNSNNATDYGAKPTLDRCGRKDSAYYFNGTSDYIKVSNNALINNNNFTYSVWFNIKTLPPYSAIPSITSAASIFEIGAVPYGYYGTGLGVGNSGYASNLGITITSGNTNGTFEGFTSDSLPRIDTWYNIVVTRSNAEVKLYINSQFIKSQSTGGLTPFYNNPLDIFLGTRCEFIQYFNGSIDDIMIFDRILSDAEIASLYITNCNKQQLSSIAGNANVCQGQQAVNFNVQPLIGATFTWSYSGTGATINGNGNEINVNFGATASSGSLTITVTGNSIQSQSREIYITVNSPPQKPSVIFGQQSFCKGNEGNFFIEPIPTATNYIWNYSGKGAALAGTSDSAKIYFSDNATDGNLTVMGYNSCGPGQLSDAFPISVMSCDPIITNNLNIPNSFTPNGDLINDEFNIRGLPENSWLIIFDRSGNKLYESANYKNDWNGTDLNGIKLETGTYWYVLSIPGIPTEFKGFVYLKR